MSASATLAKPSQGPLSPVKITAIYALVGALWIPITDQLLLGWIDNGPMLTQIQALKGGVFVLATAALLYWLIQHSVRLLREESAQLKAVIEGTPDAVFIKDIQGRYVLMNTAGARYLGKSVEEVLGREAAALLPPDKAQESLEEDRQVLTSGEAKTFEYALTVAGITRIYSCIKAPYRDVEGHINGVIGIARDITEYKRQESLLAGEKRILEMIAIDAALSEVLNAITLLFEAQAQEKAFCSLCLLDSEGHHLRYGAGPSLPEAYTRAIDGMAIGPAAASCGTAAYRRERVVVTDITTDPLWKDYRDLGLRHGLRACWSVPIVSSQGQVLGTFAIYYPKPHSPGASDLEFIDRASHLAGIVIERKLAEEALQRAHNELERRVQERTIELVRMNEALKAEIAGRQRTEAELRNRARQQAAVAELGQRALVEVDLCTLLDAAIALVAQTLEVEHVKVLERLPDGHALLLRAGVGWKEGTIGRVTVDAGADSQAGYTLLSQGPVIVENLRTETRFHSPSLLHDHGVVSGMNVIIQGKERPFGVLGAHTTRWRRFTQDDIHFLQAVANLLASSIERQRVEAALRESEERFRQLVEHLDEIFWMSTADGSQVLYVSPAYEKIRGHARGRIYENSSDWIEAIHPEDRARLQDVHARIAAGECNDEYRIIRPDGTVRWIWSRGFPIRDAAGRIYRIAGIGQDITERKQTEERLRQQQAELVHMARFALASEMASGLAHELNQPLAAIATYTEACLLLLRSGQFNSKTLLETMEQVTAQAQRAGEIIHRLRNLVRKEESQRSLVNINGLIHDALCLVEPQARQQEVQIHLELDKTLPSLFADSIQIQQVVLNLVRNAIEAMSETQTEPRILTIRTGLAGSDAIEVAVSDTGSGLSPEAMERLFMPFFTTKPTGMGLGLPLSRSIIEAHQGKLWAMPNSDRGVTFHFTLPYELRGCE